MAKIKSFRKLKARLRKREICRTPGGQKQNALKNKNQIVPKTPK
jgi:hypothetical protein